MNFPGTTNSNWTWRAKDGMITDELAVKIRKLTVLYARLGSQAVPEKAPEAETAPKAEEEAITANIAF